MENSIIQIHDIVDLINGYPFKKSDWSESSSGTKIIRIQNLNNEESFFNYTNNVVNEKYLIQKGDLLLAWSASLGIYEWEKEENAYLNQHIFKVIFKSNDITKDYFKYLISAALNELSYKMRGVGIKHITKEDLNNYEFYLPIKSDQEIICKKLNIINNLINKRNLSIKKSEEYIKSVFFEKFGDPINDNKKIGKKPLKYFGSWKSGGTPPKQRKEYYNSGTIPWFTSGELNTLFIDQSKMSITEKAISETNAKLIAPESILIGMYDTAALKTSISKIECSCNQAIAFSKIDSEKGNPLFIYYNISVGKEYWLNSRQGARQKNLSLSKIKDIQILNPNIDKQNNFAEIVKKVNHQKENLKKSLQYLNELYEATLYQSFSKGQLVKEDEIDRLINDDFEMEKLLESFSLKNSFKNTVQYDLTKDLLFKVLEKTEKKNREDHLNKFRKGIVQKFSNNQLQLLTNKELKNEINPS